MGFPSDFPFVPKIFIITLFFAGLYWFAKRVVVVITLFALPLPLEAFGESLSFA